MMSRDCLKRYLLFIIIFSCALCGQVFAEPLPFGNSVFDFADDQLNPQKPIHVLVYKPSTAKSDSRIVFVMPGITRDGERYLKDWQPYAERQGFMLVVPVFQKENYSGKDYTLRKPFEEISVLTNFKLIEKLFDVLKNREHLSTSVYALYGHSAGGQFVHRFLLLASASKDSRADLLIAANPGFYTLPFRDGTPGYQYPYSLALTTVSDDDLKVIFGKKFFLLLGERDTDPGAKNLNQEPQAKAQGSSRFARGRTFFKTAQTEAERLNTSLNWQLLTVPGVGHNNKGMAGTAANILYEHAR